jgi:hypothetical protein
MPTLKHLEKRVKKLEQELAALKVSHKTSTHRSHKTSTHRRHKTKKRGKRPLNKYFKLMLSAKRAGKPSFVYNNHTYKGTKDKRFGMIYKKTK